MQDPYLEFKIEETRVENPFWKYIRRGSMNGRDFKDAYNILDKINPNDFYEELCHKQPS